MSPVVLTSVCLMSGTEASDSGEGLATIAKRDASSQSNPKFAQQNKTLTPKFSWGRRAVREIKKLMTSLEWGPVSGSLASAGVGVCPRSESRQQCSLSRVFP